MQNAPREHSTILLTFIKLPFVFKTFVLSIFEWPLETGFTVFPLKMMNCFLCVFQYIHCSTLFLVYFIMALIMNNILFTLNIQQDKSEQTQIRQIQREPSGLGLHYLAYMSTCIITINTTHKVVKWIHLKKKLR